MEEHPEDWSDKSLKPPCDLDPDALRSIIPDFESAVEDWDEAISKRRALIQARKVGPFALLERLAE